MQHSSLFLSRIIAYRITNLNFDPFNLRLRAENRPTDERRKDVRRKVGPSKSAFDKPSTIIADDGLGSHGGFGTDHSDQSSRQILRACA